MRKNIAIILMCAGVKMKKNKKQKEKIINIKLKGIKYPDDFKVNQFIMVDFNDKVYRIILPVPFEIFIMDTVNYIQNKLLKEQQKKRIIVPGNPRPKQKIIYVPSGFKIKEKRKK